MKCYNASFNVGNVEVWASDLFLHKKDVILDVEESVEEIAEAISDFSYLSENKIINFVNRAIKSFKRIGYYKDKEENFDFFIHEQYVWKDMQDREIFTSNIKIENATN